MSGSGRALHGKGMTLQTKKVDLANEQQPRVCGAVGTVATRAAFCSYRLMFVDERALLIRVALETNGVSLGQRTNLTQSRSAVNVVTVRTFNQVFIDAMPIGQPKFGLGRQMAAVAEVRLCSNQQVLWFLGKMRRMAV